MQEAHCSYYGTLADNRKGFTLGETLLDEMYMKILAKHEAILIKNQEHMVAELRRTFSKDIKDFKSSLKSIDDRIRKLEKFVKKEKENAVQVQSTGTRDVCESTQDSKEMGKRNTKHKGIA